MSTTRPLVDFFLDEQQTPMPLCVVYDVDGPRELEVALGTFGTTADAMDAVDRIRGLLQDASQEWNSISRALIAVQPVALRLRGNLGLPGHLDAPAPQNGGADVADGSVVLRVMHSAAFAEQRRRAQRVTVTDDRLVRLLDRLVGAPGHRIDEEAAAEALEVPLTMLGGALPMVQRLLNIDQYPVLQRGLESGSVILDVPLMAEQFGVVQ